MALDFQLGQYPFRYGLAEGTEPHQVQPGVLTTAENVVWKKSGRLEKRFGTSALAATIIGGGSIAACKRLLTRGSELCLVDGTSLYSYSSTAASWALVAAVPDAGLTQRPLVDPALGVQASDTAVSGSYVVTAFMTGDPTTQASQYVNVEVTDLNTGAVLLPLRRVSPAGVAYGVRVLIIGTTAIIITSGTDASIYAGLVNLTTMAVTAPAALRTDRINTVSQNWDAALISGSTNFVIAYGQGATNIALYSYDATLVQQATASQAVANNTTRISVNATSGESLYVAYYETATTAVRAFIADPSTLAVGVVPFTVHDLSTATATSPALSVGVSRYSSTQAIVAWTGSASGIPALESKIITSAGAVTSTSHRRTYGVALTSAPFMVGSKCYALGIIYPRLTTTASTFSGNACGIFCLYPGADDGTVPAPASQHPYIASVDSLLGAKNGEHSPVFRFTELSATRAVGSAPFIGTAPSANLTWRCGLRLLDVTSGADLPVDMWRPVPVGAETYLSAAVPSVYDGLDVFDYGFAYAPKLPTVSTAAAGGVVLAGDYLYATHAEYRSAAGILYRGPTVVSSALTTAGATSANTLVISHVNVANRRHINAVERSGSILPIYRTVAGGTVPQRLSFDPMYNMVTLAYEAASQTIVDTVGDASIDSLGQTLAARPTLYTTGGILDDYSPPAAVTMCAHADRLWVLAGDQKTWWYSKAFQDDAGVAPGFHPNFRIVFAEEQTAMASMDDKAIFFSASGVKYMLGVGPAPNGQNSDFQNPTTIQSDVGCTSARSVVTTPDGVMFLSERGIYLLSRGLELSWIGRPVRDTLASYPVITSAVLVPKHNQVRFTCTDATTATVGITLVYDYVEKQWATYKHTVGGVYGGPIADACMWNGAWTFASAAGIVYTESTTSYLDAGSAYVPMTIETAWISGPANAMSASSGPLKFQSVRAFGINGTSHTDHDLTVSVGFDSEATYAQTASFLAETAVTTVGDLEECTVTIGTRRKCGSIRFKVQDSTPTTGTVGTGRGPSFDMMALEVGNKRGLVAAPASKRA